MAIRSIAYSIEFHPKFQENGYVFVGRNTPAGKPERKSQIVRYRVDPKPPYALDVSSETVIIEWPSAGHDGCAMAFAPDGTLYITSGDGTSDSDKWLTGQDLSRPQAKLLRIDVDHPAPGKHYSVPSDNPFVGREGAKPEIWTYGHRNSQALAVHPTTGALWLTEHGPQGGDELNLVQRGKNYGWPVVGFGVNYRTGSTIHTGTLREGMEPPVHVWVPSIAVSGMLFYTGDAFPGWKGSLFAGGLAGEQLARFALEGERPELADILVRRQGRIRDVRQGPDGFIYLAFEDRQGRPTSVVRVEPVARP